MSAGPANSYSTPMFGRHSPLAVRDPRLDPTVLRTLCLIGDHCDKSNRAKLKQRMIAQALGISTRTAIRHVKILVRLGYLRKWRRGTLCNGYEVVFPRIPVVSTDEVTSGVTSPARPKDEVTPRCHQRSDIQDVTTSSEYLSDRKSPEPGVTIGQALASLNGSGLGRKQGEEMSREKFEQRQRWMIEQLRQIREREQLEGKEEDQRLRTAPEESKPTSTTNEGARGPRPRWQQAAGAVS